MILPHMEYIIFLTNIDRPSDNNTQSKPSIIYQDYDHSEQDSVGENEEDKQK